MNRLRASADPRYVEAVINYAKRVADPAAPKTYENGLSYGILVGVCSMLEIRMPSEIVAADVETMRDLLWVRHVPR